MFPPAMKFHLLSTRKSVTAQRADKGPFACVFPLVQRQMPLLNETPLAVPAAERLVAAMYALVSNKSCLSIIRLLALLTFEDPFFGIFLFIL